MRQINEIIVHCTATRPEWWQSKSSTSKVNEIRRWHMARGWRDIGYHFLIDRDGTLKTGRTIGEEGAHVIGRNTGTIGVSLFGGFGSAETDSFLENFTVEQNDALRKLLDDLKSKYPSIMKISGHNEYAAKACPGFNVTKWRTEKDTAPNIPLSQPQTNTTPTAPPSSGFFVAIFEAILALFKR